MCDSNCSGNCTEGFLEKTELIPLAALVGDIEYTSNQVTLTPHLNFTSPGSVLSWEFAARSEQLSPGRINIPHIQIWRPIKRRRKVEYFLVDSTAQYRVVLEKTERYNVYKYRLNTPMEVEAGDAIAIQQPPIEASQISLAFLKDVGSSSYATTFDSETVLVLMLGGSTSETRRLPLVAAEFQPRSKHYTRINRYSSYVQLVITLC